MVKLLNGLVRVCSRTLTSIGRLMFSLCLIYYSVQMIRGGFDCRVEETQFKVFVHRVSGYKVSTETFNF